MSLTAAQADKEIRQLVHAAWVSSGFTMLWEDVPGTRPATGTASWAYVQFSVHSGAVAGLADARVRRYRRYGTLTIQVFTPRGDGYVTGQGLAKRLTDAMESKTTPGGVIFRKVTASRIGVDKLYSQINVTSAFEYDEVR